MIAALLLIPASVFFSFLFDLWAVLFSLVLSIPFIIRKRTVPGLSAYLFILILAGVATSIFTKFQFNSMTFVLQEVLYLVFFVLGFNIGLKKYHLLLIPLSAFLFVPLICPASRINPNIISSFVALLVSLLWISGVQRSLKYIFSVLGVFLIIRNGSYIALFALFSAWIIAKKRRFWPLIIIFILAGAFINETSVIERLVWFEKGLRVFLAHPLGVGFFGMKYFLAGTGVQNTVFLHSFVLQFLIEGGFFGFVILVVFILKLLKLTKEGDFKFAVLTGVILGLLDHSFYYPACGMLFALIAGLSIRPVRGSPLEADVRRQHRLTSNGVKDTEALEKKNLAVALRILFFMALILAGVMFLSSRNFAKGNFHLFSGRPQEALEQYNKVLRFPSYPAIFSARAAALSLIYDKDGSVPLEKCFALQEKALAVKDAGNPAFVDFLAAKQERDTKKLRDSCMKILFLEGVKP